MIIEKTDTDIVTIHKDTCTQDVFTIVEEYPKYPGGDDSFKAYLDKHIKYPPEAIKNKIEGKVWVEFVVDCNGEIKDVEVLRGIGGGCDEEVIRVISEMPKWIPGKENDKPVAVKYNYPINFTLSEKRNDSFSFIEETYLSDKTDVKNPKDFNEFIRLETNETMIYIDNFIDEINKTNSDSMIFYLNELSLRSQRAQLAVTELVNFDEDTTFRYAALELFRYISYACEHELNEIITIANQDSVITDRSIKNIHILSQKFTEKEKEKFDALIDAQEKFAIKFDIILK